MVVWAVLVAPARGEPAIGDDARYLEAVRRFADTVVEHGRDRYGELRTPLFVDGLQAETLEPARWECRGETWVLSNFASCQPLLRTLDGLTAVGGEARYRRAAEEASRHALNHLATPNGLLYWGGHLAWDLQEDRPVGQYANVHELKTQQPYFALMWRVDPAATRKLVETIWATHVLDWPSLDYNRHARTDQTAEPKWGATFDDDLPVPFPTSGGNLSFVNVTPPLLHSGVTLAAMGKNDEALTWTRRLISRWQQGRHPRTGLCGGQLSYRQSDRAQIALGHVHPTINEAQIVASYHQTCRYHQLPLAQMQAGERLVAAGGKCAEAGREFIRFASEDLKAYAKQCYDRKTGRFVAMMIDGTPLRWREAKTGYYVPESFAPRRPDGHLFWAYAMAYRLTGDEYHWQTLRELAGRLELGDLGQRNGAEGDLKSDTGCRDWRLLYGLLELHRATERGDLLKLACQVADNLLETQSPGGLFPRQGRSYARTGDEIPLALLHLAAALAGKRDALPPPMLDARFFHCEYHGKLLEHQQKRADKRTYDHLVFYGS